MADDDDGKITLKDMEKWEFFIYIQISSIPVQPMVSQVVKVKIPGFSFLIGSIKEVLEMTHSIPAKCTHLLLSQGIQVYDMEDLHEVKHYGIIRTINYQDTCLN